MTVLLLLFMKTGNGRQCNLQNHKDFFLQIRKKFTTTMYKSGKDIKFNFCPILPQSDTQQSLSDIHTLYYYMYVYIRDESYLSS